MPGEWGHTGADCLLSEVDGDGHVEADTPAPREYPWALASDGDALVVGTGSQDLDADGTAPGRVYRRLAGDWRTTVETPAAVTSVVVR